eukprot:Tbor_TRINITY_DN5404_c5_g1::TRINITY_DN5404_c5_g1_i3::g.24743::m.24743/K14938/NVD, DAF36; cholesterol 7-desaturase
MTTTNQTISPPTITSIQNQIKETISIIIPMITSLNEIVITPILNYILLLYYTYDDLTGTGIPILTLTLIIIITTSIYLYLFQREDRKPGPQFKGNFNRISNNFIKKREAHYPPPYPNGWYKLCDIADLENGNIINISALGLDLVVFKGLKKGKIGVLSAHCPHLGAHLGDGGKVVGDCIQCPFHGWEMDADTGKCINIPYSDVPPPKSAKVPKYIHVEYLGMVWMWFHVEGEAPQYSLLDLRHINNDNNNNNNNNNNSKWCRTSVSSYTYNMHITDMAENGVDYYHFNFLHNIFPVKFLDNLLTMTYDVETVYHDNDPDFSRSEVGGDPEHQSMETNEHLSAMKLTTHVHLFNYFTIPYHQKTVVRFDGPSVLHFDVRTPLGNMWLIKSVLPVSPFKQYVEDVWFAERSVPRIASKVLAIISKGALEQDRNMWENRIYKQMPILVKGDGPFLRYRRWFDQFYSESSEEWGRGKHLKIDDW